MVYLRLEVHNSSTVISLQRKLSKQAFINSGRYDNARICRINSLSFLLSPADLFMSKLKIEEHRAEW
jgi:hypothetical protein